jgi:predicted RNase H-like nuclease
VIVAGVDAWKGKWIAVLLGDGAFASSFVGPDFASIHARLSGTAAIGVDIPIGEGPRAADAEARRFVGPRRSSVFPTPIRSALAAETYELALEVSRAELGKGLSRQSYGLRRRILEVEQVALLDERVLEVHPEVSFRALAGCELAPKRTAEGLRQRLAALATVGIEPAPPVNDDLLDAAVAAWSALRYANGVAQPLPEGHRERIGAIWY